MHTPQEIDVWYILPAVRKEIALALAKKGMKQREIAKKLGMTEAAVSQYMKNKRAKSIELPAKIREDIHKAAGKLATEQDCHRYEVQTILNTIKMSGFLCKIHRKYDKVPECCNVCLQATR
jgi:predicted transcriptional regulator